MTKLINESNALDLESIKRLIRCFALLLAVPSLVHAQDYKLLIKGGYVIDPKNGIDSQMDVAIADGKDRKGSFRNQPRTCRTGCGCERTVCNVGGCELLTDDARIY